MRKLRQWLFNGLAAMSLVLCVATASAWVRSWCVTDLVLLSTRQGVRWAIVSSEGQFGCGSQWIYSSATGSLKWERFSSSAELFSRHGTYDEAARPDIRFAYWQAFVATGILPLGVFLPKRFRMLREKRIDSHRPIVLIVMWLTLGPLALISLLLLAVQLVAPFFDFKDHSIDLVKVGLSAGLASISCSILYSTTRRFMNKRHGQAN